MEYSINVLMLSVIVCAIFVMSIACGVLWMRLARTEERSQALDDENKTLRNQDALIIAETLLCKLSTMPKHKKSMIMSWTREHQPWQDRKVHCE